MADSYFTVLEEHRPAEGRSSTGRYLAGPATIGPWSRELQHGGPPTALAVTLAARLVADAGRPDLVALRMAADFIGPVPVAEVTTSARIVRLARSAALVDVTVAAGGRDCLACRIWFVRSADTGALVAPASLPPAIPEPTQAPASGMTFGYGESIDWRFVSGETRIPGPAAAWTRSRLPLLGGPDTVEEPAEGLARVVLVADSASGISAELDWSEWSFVNVDLDVHLVRPPQGDWVFMDAVTQLGPSGSAVARSSLSDTTGTLGGGLQTLVVGRIA